jgi:phosphoenolpyruvate-protein kinase (PTS system EI component)
LLEEAPDALAAQLRGVLAARCDARVRIMLPLVEDPAEIDAVRRLIGDQLVSVGAMVETPRAAERAADLARAGDFLSIGTNDLTAATLGVDRFAGGDAVAHDPRVLRHIARVAAAARDAGVPVEVCGEAASDPRLCPLLVGLGIDELSVGAARVGTVRAWVRGLAHADSEAFARRALDAPSAAAVAALGRPLLDEPGDDVRERGDRRAGVVAVRTQA